MIKVLNLLESSIKTKAYLIISTLERKGLINYKLANKVYEISRIRNRRAKFNNIDIILPDDIKCTNKGLIKIYKPYFYDSVLNQKFKEFNEKVVLVKHYQNCELFPRSSLIIEKNGRILLEYNYINLNDLIFQDSFIIKVNKNQVYYKLKKTNKIKVKNGISLLGKGSWNYFHMLFEYLPKLLFLDIDTSKFTLIVDDTYKSYNAFHVLICELFKGDILYVSKEQSVWVENLIYITTPFYLTFNKQGKFDESDLRYNSRIIDWIERLNKLLIQKVEGSLLKERTFDKIFISRTNRMRAYNNTEIESVAEKMGYEIVDFSKLNLVEQFVIMRNAKYFMGPTGASFTNLVFCKPNTIGITWMHDSWGDFPVYSTLAKISGVKLIYLEIESNLNQYQGAYHLDAMYFSNTIHEIEIEHNNAS